MCLRVHEGGGGEGESSDASDEQPTSSVVEAVARMKRADAGTGVGGGEWVRGSVNPKGCEMGNRVREGEEKGGPGVQMH